MNVTEKVIPDDTTSKQQQQPQNDSGRVKKIKIIQYKIKCDSQICESEVGLPHDMVVGDDGVQKLEDVDVGLTGNYGQ